MADPCQWEFLSRYILALKKILNNYVKSEYILRKFIKSIHEYRIWKIYKKKNKSSLSVSLMHDFSFWTFQNGVAKKAGWQINIMEEIEGRVYYVSGIYLWSDNIGLKYTINMHALAFLDHIYFSYIISIKLWTMNRLC